MGFLGKSKKIAVSYCVILVFSICYFMVVSTVSAVETELLFVGEDVSTLTIASLKAESPENAPAVASIITKEKIDKYGIRTLGEALAMEPGFYIAPAEWGNTLYMRGVADSVLFLYDTVPLTSDGTKSINPIGEEISLAPVKRIEIIRGPGSVLWGADAFAGIVNIVPLKGRDIDGVEMSFRGGLPTMETMAAINMGRNAGNWEGLLSFSVNQVAKDKKDYNVVKFKGEGSSPALPGERFGSGSINNSSYLEALLNFSWHDVIQLTARWSEVNNNYVMEDLEGQYAWPEKRESPFRFVRLEGKQSIGKNNFTLKSWYNELYVENSQVDLSWIQKNRVYQGEILYDREVWHNHGLFTMGGTYRYNSIEGAPLQKLYIPDYYIDPGNIRIPVVPQEDYNTNLASFFTQYKHHWKNFEAWAGIRIDNHSQYDLTFSHNLGVKWNPGENWYLKFLYGTAFRTPYNIQLVQGEDLDPEEVHNASINFFWSGRLGLSFDATLFWNSIYHHIQEEPFLYSMPGRQDIYGVEIKAAWRVNPWLNIWANTTIFANYGDDEEYRTTYYYINFENGTWIPVYKSWSVPFDTGASGLFNLGIEWMPTDSLEFSLISKYINPVVSWYDKGEVKFTSSARLLTDITGTAKDVFMNGLDFQVSLKNIFNSKYDVPGTYGYIETEPMQVYLGFNYKF